MMEITEIRRLLCASQGSIQLVYFRTVRSNWFFAIKRLALLNAINGLLNMKTMRGKYKYGIGFIKTFGRTDLCFVAFERQVRV